MEQKPQQANSCRSRGTELCSSRGAVYHLRRRGSRAALDNCVSADSGLFALENKFNAAVTTYSCVRRVIPAKGVGGS